jgi:hypothetical protein
VSDESMVEFLEGMVKIEDKIVESVNVSLDSINNAAVRGALKGISYDSMKHALMYRSAISLISEHRLPLEEAQLDEQREVVDRHIEMEAEVIGKLETMIPEVEDERISLILNAIVEDERRHHKLLMRVHEILVGGEAITEQEWWEAIWKDVPGLWT